MASEWILFVYFIMWYLLAGLACLFILSGLDDLFFDVYYWVRFFFRLWKTRQYQPLTYEQLAKKEEQMIAVLIPCWHEAGVIGTMLRHNCYSIDYSNYYLFVGVYPNDPQTVNEVQEVAEEIKNVQCVIGPTPGPTNKASNLNSIYAHVKEFEKKLEKPFTIFVFHDSEDIIHPLSFKLYNYLMPRKDMIQIPVFPLALNHWDFTHWTYADEFSENHTKDIIVREAIGAHVPSAGVGTAFSSHALEVLEDPKTKQPFSTDSLTEDYRTSLALRMHGLTPIFLVETITRMTWRPRGFFRKGYVQKPVREYIATRAMFPVEYTKAVRQKSRWIIGIVFQEWMHTKWPKGWKVRFTLAHDRKAFVTYMINVFGYAVFLFWIIYSLCTSTNPAYPSLQEQLKLNPWVWWAIFAVIMIMIERMIQRMIAIVRVYGWIPAILSIPRSFYSNWINLHALIRAYRVYYSAPKQTQGSSNQPAWDKTDHHFPGSHILTPYRKKIGDLLIEKNVITKEQLSQALIEQRKTGARLGQVLCQLNFINTHQLFSLLSKQYHLALIPQSEIKTLQKDDYSAISKELANWLTKNEVHVVSIDNKKKVLTISIEDPTNELFIEKIINYIKPYEAQFVLVDPSC